MGQIFTFTIIYGPLLLGRDEDILTVGELLLKRHLGEVVICH